MLYIALYNNFLWQQDDNRGSEDLKLAEFFSPKDCSEYHTDRLLLVGFD